MRKKDEAKWEIIAEKRLSLVGTDIVIEFELTYGTGTFHVHRHEACFGVAFRLAEAKDRAQEVVAELLEMGIDP